jgi:hypothetical protein
MTIFKDRPQQNGVNFLHHYHDRHRHPPQPPQPLQLTLQRRVRVKVGSRHRHTPPPPPHRFTVPLTVADVQLRHEQLPFAYFFATPLCATRLQASLTTVVQQQFAVAGGHICPATYTSIVCQPDVDTIPLSFATVNGTLAAWNAVVDTNNNNRNRTGNNSKHRGHGHQSGHGRHPLLLPLHAIGKNEYQRRWLSLAREKERVRATKLTMTRLLFGRLKVTTHATMILIWTMLATFY